MTNARRLNVAIASFSAFLSVASPLAAQPAASIPEIPRNSPLLKLDPKMVACGKRIIAQMDATRITTGWENQKFPAFRVIGNTYSVGIKAVTAYLIKTNDGLILIDTTWAETAPWVGESIEKLGFKLSDIKIILGSHAHPDHIGGNTWMKAHAPNAKLMIMDTDAPVMEQGTPARGGLAAVPGVKVDRILHDGDKVTLGDVTVDIWKTAGHTPGATSFLWRTAQGNKTYTVMIVGSQFVANPLVPVVYPGVVRDQIDSWTKILSFKPDVWFGGHTWQHDNIDKYEAMLVDPKAANPFVDPKSYQCLAAARSQEFVEALAKQRAAAAKQ